MLSARPCNAQQASDAASKAEDRRRLDKVVMVRSAKSSPAGLTTQVGFIRLAYLKCPKSGEPISDGPRVEAHFRKRMECRVISAFTRVFNALCPAMTSVGSARLGWKKPNAGPAMSRGRRRFK